MHAGGISRDFFLWFYDPESKFQCHFSCAKNDFLLDFELFLAFVRFKSG